MTETWHADAGGPPPARLVRLRAGQGGRIGLRAALWTPQVGPEAGLVLLLTGRTEYLEKWAPAAHLLTQRGFAVASLDWRGQGLSDRDPAVGRLGHVGGFAKYQNDLRALLAWEPVAARPAPRVLLSHSMGGCIALRALVDGALAEPEAGPLPEAAIWSAPMWGLAMAPGLGGAFRVVVKTAEAMGRDLRAPPFRGGTDPYVLRADFEGNVLTADRREWDRMHAAARAHPDLTTGAPTVGWFSAALREMALLAPQAPPGPGLVLLGDEEKVVSTVAIRGHLLGAPDTLQLVTLPGGRHEAFMHRPDHPVGARAWAELDAFLAARGLGRPAPVPAAPPAQAPSRAKGGDSTADGGLSPADGL